MAQLPDSTPKFSSGKAPAAPPKKVLESYKKIKILGKGSFGKAFLVTCGSDGVSFLPCKLLVNIRHIISGVVTCCRQKDRYKEDERR